MFGYSLKLIFREKQALFWGAIFPIVLMTLFYLTFGSVTVEENNIDVRKLGITIEESGAYQDNFKEMMNTLEEEYRNGNSELAIEISYDSIESNKEKVENGELDACYNVTSDDIEVFLAPKYSVSTGMIARQIADAYNTKYQIIEDAIKKDPSKISEIMNEITENEEYISVDESSSGKDPYFWYFVSTIVMGIMFSYMNGVEMVGNLRANVSASGLRIAVSPVSKMKLVMNNFFAALLVKTGITMLQLLIVEYVFGKSVFIKPGLLIIAVVLANAFAICVGVIFGFVFKGSVEQIISKSLGIVMACEFISGEMIADLPGIIEKNCPIVNDILPTTVIKLIFYRLTVWDDVGDLYVNFIKLVAGCVIILTASVILLRRETYESV